MSFAAKLRAPGWYRAALYDVLGFAFAFGLVVLVRALQHQHPVSTGSAITIVALIAVPLFFMVGLGARGLLVLLDRPGRPTRAGTTPPTGPTPGATTSGSTPTTR